MSIADNMKTITDAARKLIESDNTNSHQSIVHWQKGMPKERGEYLVSLKDGTVCRDEWRELYCEDKIKRWVYNDDDVVAWCKLSDIEPYKEEQP